MNKNEIYKAFSEKYGAEKQIIKAIEELAELQQALCKYVLDKSNFDVFLNICEEMADVEIMLEQLKILLNLELYDISEISDGIKEEKLKRMEKSLQEVKECI